MTNKNHCIVFLPTNGAGLGHLTRLLAIARRMKKLENKLEIIFLSTSPAMHIIMREGFLGYYVPTRNLFPKYISNKQWNRILQQQLSSLFELHNPGMLVFDGATPYGGIISTLARTLNLKTVWIRREQSTKDLPLDHQFDIIIIPGEAGGMSVIEREDIRCCNPIIYLDKSELLSREKVREQWGIKEKEKLVYIQLGAGNINDIHSILSLFISELIRRKDTKIIVGESFIGRRLMIDSSKVTILRDYPNSMYFNGFDLVVSAAGYNTYHELIYLGVPTIFVPNERTGRDNQVERALNAAIVGAGICLRNPNTSDVIQALNTGLDTKINQIMRGAASELLKENGADEAASFLLKFRKAKLNKSSRGRK